MYSCKSPCFGSVINPSVNKGYLLRHNQHTLEASTVISYLCFTCYYQKILQSSQWFHSVISGKLNYCKWQTGLIKSLIWNLFRYWYTKFSWNTYWLFTYILYFCALWLILLNLSEMLKVHFLFTLINSRNFLSIGF